jgi:pimeloyl-ACP methyl ester carboxylesterase
VLREQLGVDPGPELTAAHQSVLGARTELPEDGTALWRGPVPEVRYALSGGGHVAHCVLGEGRDDLVVLGDWFNNVEVFWDHPVGEGALRRLGALGRVITLDPRGQGLSDRLDGPPSAATWAEDVLAVLDAVGSHRCVVFAPSSSTAAALALVRLCPERVRGLVVVNGMLNGVGTQLEMLGAPETSRVITSRWGFGPGLHGVASSHTGDPRFTSWFGRLMRSSLSPGEVEPWLRYATSLDCAAAAPDVRVRTLVVHREGDRVIPPDKGQELADALPDARLEIVPGADHAWFCGAVAPIVTATARFLAQLPR